jgi:hypothetical protein
VSVSAFFTGAGLDPLHFSLSPTSALHFVRGQIAVLSLFVSVPTPLRFTLSDEILILMLKGPDILPDKLKVELSRSE